MTVLPADVCALAHTSRSMVRGLALLGGPSGLPQRAKPERFRPLAARNDPAGRTWTGQPPRASGRRLDADQGTEAAGVELHEYNEAWAQKSKANLKELRRTRNDKDVTENLKGLEKAAKTSENVMPHLVKCCHAYATVGEMAGVFRQTFGEWKEPDFY